MLSRDSAFKHGASHYFPTVLNDVHGKKYTPDACPKHRVYRCSFLVSYPRAPALYSSPVDERRRFSAVRFCQTSPRVSSGTHLYPQDFNPSPSLALGRGCNPYLSSLDTAMLSLARSLSRLLLWEIHISPGLYKRLAAARIARGTSSVYPLSCEQERYTSQYHVSISLFVSSLCPRPKLPLSTCDHDSTPSLSPASAASWSITTPTSVSRC